MCGIAGFIDLAGTPVDPQLVQRMSDAIAHRGPDGHGTYVHDNVGLGHRRLAILDLTTAARQPMQSDDGRYAIVYNGEVYNFKALRAELANLGHRFHSDSDTEVVLCAWQEWGEECVSRFNGMFAFAVLDELAGTIHLVRDRYGIKPLYWYCANDKFAFGSEQRAIKTLPSYSERLDLQGLVEYFTFQNIVSDRTLSDGIKILPAGHVLELHTDGSAAPTLRQYWDFDFTNPDVNVDEAEYVEELDRLLCQAVERQLVSDVDVGSYLSGGMDSGAISALAAGVLPGMKTFTVGFDVSSASGLELGFDERARAEAMSAHFGTEQYEMVLKAGDMERALPQVTSALEEPRVGQSYPNFYAAQLASKFVKVVLSGVGSDEMFAGYPWRYHAAARAESLDQFSGHYFGLWNRLLPGVDRREVFRPIWSDVRHFSPHEVFQGVFASQDTPPNTPSDFVNRCLYFDAKVFLHGLLVVEDKLSMAHSLESRVPFLDNDLVNFAMSCPVSLKLNDPMHLPRLDANLLLNQVSSAYDPRTDGKRVLRKVMLRHLPEGISEYRKQGFSGPDATWFKGPSMEMVRQRLLTDSAPIYDYLDYRTISALVEEHLSGLANHRLLIWSLLTTSEALRS